MAIREYLSPTGALILGTLERLTGRAEIDGIDEETGEPSYSGGTEIFYDDQETVMRDGPGDVYRRMVYLDEDGREWTFDQLVAGEMAP